MTSSPLVSIIVPTKNSESTLDECLRSIVQQTYKRVEIILVDNYSEDKTLEIARRYTQKVYSMGPERSPQINFGVKMASGKYVYVFGSDFVLADRELISEAVSAAETGNYAAVLIHNTSDPSVSFWAKVRKFERDMYINDETNVAVRFIRRDVFVKLGGFDPTIVAGEDYDLHNRLIQDHPITKITAQEIHLGEPKSLGEVARKHYYYGKTLSAFISKNRSRGTKQIMPIRIAYLRHGIEFLRHPDLTIGFLVYQMVRYTSSICGVIVNGIRR